MQQQEKEINFGKVLSNHIDNLSTGNVNPELLELNETKKIEGTNLWATKELDEDELYESFEQEYLIQKNPYNTCFPI